MTLEKVWLVVSLIVTCLLTSCTASASIIPTSIVKPTVQLTISGSEDVAAILDAIGTAFTQAVPTHQLRILSGSGIEPSMKGVQQGILDIAAINRPINPAETNTGLKFVAFGKASIVIFVHPDLGIQKLSSKQVKAIFSGEITNWSSVGGPDEPIVVYVRNEENGNTQILREKLLGSMSFPSSAEIINSGDEMRTAVAVTTGSIGFGAWPPVKATGINVQPIALDGITPDDPLYPIINVFGISYREESASKIGPFIEWLVSMDGQSKLAEFGVLVKDKIR